MSESAPEMPKLRRSVLLKASDLVGLTKHKTGFNFSLMSDSEKKERID